jgi:hypothetical protein
MGKKSPRTANNGTSVPKNLLWSEDTTIGDDESRVGPALAIMSVQRGTTKNPRFDEPGETKERRRWDALSSVARW